MNTQIKFAIIAIAVIIPLSIIVVYGTNSNQQFTTTDNSKLQVISSFYPLHEFSQNVGQETEFRIVVVPEFGIITLLILVTSIIGMIFVTRRNSFRFNI